MATAAQTVDKQWIANLLPHGDYTNVRFASGDPEVIVADHPSRPNITLRVRPAVGAITVIHSWRLKKAGWGQTKEILAAINRANSLSWLSSFSQDNEGDLLVTSYITLANGLSEEDVLAHLEKEAAGFLEAISASDLRKWMP